MWLLAQEAIDETAAMAGGIFFLILLLMEGAIVVAVVAAYGESLQKPGSRDGQRSFPSTTSSFFWKLLVDRFGGLCCC